ncbi:MAG: glycosyltransferase family 9 protein [Candidatus Omnitrophota bacterium]
MVYARLDCRYFRGDRPCSYNTSCSACPDYQPQGKKILIIKLAATGDVLRTTPVLRGIKRKYPRSFITWITEREAVDLLKDNNYIDRLLVYGLPDVERLKVERFDVLICLDKEIEAIVLANQVKAKKKFGFGFDPRTGNAVPFNRESGYAWELGLSDELKFKKNEKSYPQIIFEMAKLRYDNDEYILNISETDRIYAQDLLNRTGVPGTSPIVGLNTGAGSRFANKAWTERGFAELIRLIRADTDASVFLLGGPKESQLNARIASRTGDLAYSAGCYHSLGQFAAIVEACSLIVSGDTVALHIAIALKKFTVAIFGPTCDTEVDLYGRGVKVTSPIECRPCYRKQCDKKNNCMDLIKPEEVFAAVQKLFSKCKH